MINRNGWNYKTSGQETVESRFMPLSLTQAQGAGMSACVCLLYLNKDTVELT